MTAFLIVVAYVMVAGFATAIIYSFMYADENYSDGMEWPIAALLGLVWPLMLAVAVPGWLGMYFYRKIVAYNKKREAI